MPIDSKDKIFRELMEQYGTDLLRLCCMYLRDYQLAEDAVQDTFIKVYRGLDQFRGDAPVKAWIIRIAVNTCKNIIRTRWFRMERQELPETVHAPLPDMEQRTDVHSAVSSLPVSLREVILLYYFEGFSVREISQILKIKEGAVLQRMNRGRKRLRDVLREDFSDDRSSGKNK